MNPNRAPLVLASASPRRRELLEALGLEIDIEPVGLDEARRPGEPPEDLALRLAREKAIAAAARRPARDVLAADTIVLAGNDVLGKPAGPEDAARMLRALSGRWHAVITGVALVTAAGQLLDGSARSEVRFAELEAGEIAGYVAGAEPYDKAGAYAVQGIAAWFVEEVRGSVSNVVGLPLEVVRRLFRRAGLPLPPLRKP
ncbi:MAG: septum formation protein Maf [Acidobacteria bacterium]|nr:septum formation protein Maf [Acidobacteriota bacterium]